MIVPLHTPYVNASVRMAFDDDYFLRHDGYWPSTFELGDLKFQRRQHFFVMLSGSGPEKFSRRYQLTTKRWKAVFSMVNFEVPNAVIVYPLGVVGREYWLHRLEVDKVEAWEKDVTNLWMFDLVDKSTLPVFVRSGGGGGTMI
jgi:hypothetical protein